jgi:hypothetical protein
MGKVTGMTLAALWVGTTIGALSAAQGVAVAQTRYAFPDDQNILMSNFHESIVSMDLVEYSHVLHDDYRFCFRQVDIENLGLVSDHLNREEDLNITANMFLGLVEPAITQISIDVLEPQGIWEESAHPDFPNSLRREYLIDMVAMRVGASTILVQGLVEFYASSRDSVIDASTTLPYWQLRGIVDQTGGGKADTENTSWGQFKWLYQVIIPGEGKTWGRVKQSYQ